MHAEQPAESHHRFFKRLGFITRLLEEENGDLIETVVEEKRPVTVIDLTEATQEPSPPSPLSTVTPSASRNESHSRAKGIKVPPMKDLLSGVCLCLIGVGDKRASLLTSRAIASGATVIPLTTLSQPTLSTPHLPPSDKPLYVVTGDRLCRGTAEELRARAAAQGIHTELVSPDWLSECFLRNVVVEASLYPASLPSQPSSPPNSDQNSQDSPHPNTEQTGTDQRKTVGRMHTQIKRELTPKSKHPPSFNCASPVDSPKRHKKELPDQPKWRAGGAFGPHPIDSKRHTFACQQSGTTRAMNLNEHLTMHLEPLVAIYAAEGDQWRSYGYRKAVGSLRSCPRTIKTLEDAKALHGIGKKMLQKIEFILENGYLDRTLEKSRDPHTQAILELSQVFGIGDATARRFTSQGFRSVKDLQQHGQHLLNRQQLIGIKHYSDLLQRIPRQEVSEIAERIRVAAVELFGDVEVVCCGSYRRGLPHSGDCDVLISHPRPTTTMLKALIKSLHLTGTLTDDLSVPDDSGMVVYRGTSSRNTRHPFTAGEDHVTYMGIGCLGPGQIHRRVDIKMYPTQHFAFALLYFTGSDHFNRSMRYFAKRKNLTLSDKGLAPCTRVGGHVVAQGETIRCDTERDVFAALGLEYRPPEQRNCGQPVAAAGQDGIKTPS